MDVFHSADGAAVPQGDLLRARGLSALRELRGIIVQRPHYREIQVA